MTATSLSRRALLRRSASLFVVGLTAHGCTDVVQTLYPYMGNDLRMIATDVALLVRSLQGYCESADTGAFITDWRLLPMTSAAPCPRFGRLPPPA